MDYSQQYPANYQSYQQNQYLPPQQYAPQQQMYPQYQQPATQVDVINAIDL